MACRRTLPSRISWLLLLHYLGEGVPREEAVADDLHGLIIVQQQQPQQQQQQQNNNNDNDNNNMNRLDHGAIDLQDDQLLEKLHSRAALTQPTCELIHSGAEGSQWLSG
ncbi:unnamed protein product [Polarella glacialis]|uniref:Secreted protein n=1 Tax=Polarella glacialis TaxID=89957 RepID=A0A813HMY5_POLGL|nr:unnamed protein product [Polarella glacialis]